MIFPIFWKFSLDFADEATALKILKHYFENMIDEKIILCQVNVFFRILNYSIDTF